MRIRRGLDLPIEGAPQALVEEKRVGCVALMPPDHPGLNVRLLVREGESVGKGQPLFANRREPAVRFVAPRAGRVTHIHRGERRVVESVVLAASPDDDANEPQQLDGDPNAWSDGAEVRRRLLANGLWPALRSRPFGHIPHPDARPDAVFVTALDTNPLAGPLDSVVPSLADELVRGAQVLTTLTAGTVHVCTDAHMVLPPFEHARIDVTRFSGPHPAGLVGTHMQRLDAPGRNRAIWYVGWQDVVAIGRLATTGVLWTDRYVALGGPPVKRPRWLLTSLGASVTELVADEVRDTPCRFVSGSVLSGRQASGWGAYLGRYHSQLSVLPEPGTDTRARRRAFSFHRLFSRRPTWSTARNGDVAPLIPLDTFERVVPLDVLPTALVRALLVGDLDAAERLGCLELEEEDLALCSFLCPSKIDYGVLLRRVLDQLAAELPEQGP